MNTARVLNITYNEKGKMYAMAERRKFYVAYLQNHKHNSHTGRKEQEKILDWTKRMMTTSDTFHS